MSSPLLALFGRSLREDNRLKTTYIARVGLVLVILLYLFTVGGSFGWGNAPGLRFFTTVVYINFFFVVLAGVSHFATAITEEKEEMTLGLLRMTNLNALSILLGKSTTRVIAALLLLAAQFPFTLLAISLGGVAVRQVVAAYCTLGAFIVFLANLALLASVVCRRSTGAAILTFLILVSFFAVVPFFHWLSSLAFTFGMVQSPSRAAIAFDWIAEAAQQASPFARLGQILGTGFSDPVAGAQVWSNLALGVFCFLLAWSLFEIFCNEQHEASQPRSLIAKRVGFFRAFGPGRAWAHPLPWKDFYFLTGGKVWLGIRFLAYGLILALVVWVPHRFGAEISVGGLGAAAMSIAIPGCYLEMCFLAASFLRHERRWKTLSGLAVLPMSMRRIVWQKILGCLPSLIPAAAYFGLGFLCVLGASERSWGLHWSFDAIVGWAVFISQSILFLHLTTWLSLYLRRGAFPAAIAIYFIISPFFSVVSALFFREISVVLPFMLAATIVANIVLNSAILKRLEKLAEED